MDIPEEILLENRIYKIPRPTARRLISKRLDVKKKYMTTLEQYMVEHNILQKLVQLKKARHRIKTTQIAEIINDL